MQRVIILITQNIYQTIVEKENRTLEKNQTDFLFWKLFSKGRMAQTEWWHITVKAIIELESARPVTHNFELFRPNPCLAIS